MKIIIVDDNKTFRDCLKYFLQKNLKHHVINEANNGVEFLKLENIYNADIILMDLQMPELNGIISTERVLWEMSHLKIIAITMFKDQAYLEELVSVGFKGCIFKNQIYEQLPVALEIVQMNKLYFPEHRLMLMQKHKYNNAH